MEFVTDGSTSSIELIEVWPKHKWIMDGWMDELLLNG